VASFPFVTSNGDSFWQDGAGVHLLLAASGVEVIWTGGAALLKVPTSYISAGDVCGLASVNTSSAQSQSVAAVDLLAPLAVQDCSLPPAPPSPCANDAAALAAAEAYCHVLHNSSTHYTCSLLRREFYYERCLAAFCETYVRTRLYADLSIRSSIHRYTGLTILGSACGVIAAYETECGVGRRTILDRCGVCYGDGFTCQPNTYVYGHCRVFSSGTQVSTFDSSVVSFTATNYDSCSYQLIDGLPNGTANGYLQRVRVAFQRNRLRVWSGDESYFEFLGLSLVNNGTTNITQLTSFPYIYATSTVISDRAVLRGSVDWSIQLQQASLIINWNGEDAVISLGANYAGSSAGLCGSFNNNTTDDLYLPGGVAVATNQQLNEHWVLDSCLLTFPPSPPVPCDGSALALVDAENYCNVLLSNTFATCRTLVSATPYITACIADSCAAGLTQGGCSAIQAYEAACSGAGGAISSIVDRCGMCNGDGSSCSGSGAVCRLFTGYGLLTPSGTLEGISQGCEYVIASDCSASALYSIHYFQSPTVAWVAIRGQGFENIEVNTNGLVLVNGVLFDKSSPYLRSSGQVVTNANGVEVRLLYNSLVVSILDTGTVELQLASSLPPVCGVCGSVSTAYAGNIVVPPAITAAADSVCREKPAVVCSEATRAQAELYCGPLTDPNGPYAVCQTDSALNEALYTACVDSYCEFGAGANPCQTMRILEDQCLAKSASSFVSVIDSCGVCYGASDCLASVAGACRIYGNVRYRTFDGYDFSFAGQCQYVLAQSSNPSYSFELSMDSSACAGSPSARCPGELTLQTDGPTLVVTPTGLAVDGAPNTVWPFQNQQASVTRYFNHMSVSLFRGALIIDYFDTAIVQVRASTALRQLVSGLCGNLDGIPDNDLAFQNNNTQLNSSYTFEMAASWQAAPQVCVDVKPTAPTCGDLAAAQAYCAPFLNIAGPYVGCFTFLPSQPYYDLCVQTHCQCASCACDVMSAYEFACTSAGPITLGSIRGICKACSDNSTACLGATPPTCQAFGTSSFRSLAGAVFSFPGQCEYVLARDRVQGRFAVHVRTRGSGGLVLGVVTSGGVTTISETGNIVSSDTSILNLPTMLRDGTIISRAVGSSLILITIRSVAVTVQYDLATKLVQVTVPDSEAGDVDGLCGDTGTSAAAIAADAWAYGVANQVTEAAQVLTSGQCKSVRPVINPCDTSPNAAEAAERCSLLTAPTGTYAGCHAAVTPDSYYDLCLQDLCSAQRLTWGTACLPSVNAYQTECVAKGGSFASSLIDSCGVCFGTGESCMRVAVTEDRTCFAFGDPHFITFDGTYYAFQGQCEYSLAQGAVQPEVGVDFDIRVRQTSGGVTLVRSVDILLPLVNMHVMLSQAKAVTVNGAVVTVFPQTFSNAVTISQVSAGVQVRLIDQEVTLVWDGRAMVAVTVGPRFVEHMFGLCGSFDMVADNDLVARNGSQIANTPSDVFSFATSWRQSTSNTTCAEGVPNLDACATDAAAVPLAETFCGPLASTPTTERYSSCQGLMDLTPYYSACRFDTCGCNSTACACESIRAFEYACIIRGGEFISAVDKCGVCFGNGSTCSDTDTGVKNDTWVIDDPEPGPGLNPGGFGLRFQNNTGILSTRFSSLFAKTNTLIQFLIRPLRYGGVILSYMYVESSSFSAGGSVADLSGLCIPQALSDANNDVLLNTNNGKTFALINLNSTTLEAQWGTSRLFFPGVSLSLDEWNLVSIVWVQSSTANTMTIYTRSETAQLAFRSVNFATTERPLRPGGLMALGQYLATPVSPVNSQASTPLYGDMDEMRIYESSTNTYESARMSQDFQRRVLPGDQDLVKLWTFNEGQGNRITDSAAVGGAVNFFLPQPWPAPKWVLSDAPLLLAAPPVSTLSLETVQLTCALFIQSNRTVCSQVGQATTKFYFDSCVSAALAANDLNAGMVFVSTFSDLCQSLLNLPNWPLAPFCHDFDPSIKFPKVIGDNCDVPCEEGAASLTDPNLCVCNNGFFGARCNQICPGGLLNPCFGHGTCLKDRGCLCDSNWAGSTSCDRCGTNFAGLECEFAVRDLSSSTSNLSSASVFGAGHVSTFEGFDFDFWPPNGAYVLLASSETPTARLQVVSRQVPCGTGGNSKCVSEVLMKVDGDEVRIRAPIAVGGDAVVTLNGNALAGNFLPQAVGLADLGLRFAKSFSGFELSNNGWGMLVSIAPQDTALDVSARVTRLAGGMTTSTSTSPAPTFMYSCHNLTGLFGTCADSSSSLSVYGSSPNMTGVVELTAATPNPFTSSNGSDLGSALYFDGIADGLTSGALTQLRENKTVTLSFFFKPEKRQGTLLTVVQNSTFAVLLGDKRDFVNTTAYTPAATTTGLYLNAVFLPVIGSTVKLSNLPAFTFRVDSYDNTVTPGTLQALLLVVSGPVVTTGQFDTAIGGTWSISTVLLAYGQEMIDTGVSVEVDKWNKMELVYRPDTGLIDMYFFVVGSSGLSASRTYFVGPGVIVNGVRLGLARWIASLNSVSPPGTAYIGSIDEMRLLYRISNAGVVLATWDQAMSEETADLTSLWRFDAGQGFVVRDVVAGQDLLLSRTRPPAWVLSDLTVVPQDAKQLDKTLSAAAIIGSSESRRRRRDLATESGILFWPAALPTGLLSEAQQTVALQRCYNWIFNGSVHDSCASLEPLPAVTYYWACLTNIANRGLSAAPDGNGVVFSTTQGLTSVFAYASYCQGELSLAESPSQSLCNEGLRTEWIGPTCTQRCVFGEADTKQVGNDTVVYCKCDSLHWGPTCELTCSNYDGTLLCGGHGSCDPDTGDCVCWDRYTNPSVSNCSLCAEGWYGSDCSVAVTLPQLAAYTDYIVNKSWAEDNRTADTPILPVGACVTFGDPHLTTLSGTSYDLGMPGLYTLLRTDNTQVQVLQAYSASGTSVITNEIVFSHRNAHVRVRVRRASGALDVRYRIGSNSLVHYLRDDALTVGFGLSIAWHATQLDPSLVVTRRRLHIKVNLGQEQGINMTVTSYAGVLSGIVVVPERLHGTTTGLCGQFTN
jgi:hypothetical protein